MALFKYTTGAATVQYSAKMGMAFLTNQVAQFERIEWLKLGVVIIYKYCSTRLEKSAYRIPKILLTVHLQIHLTTQTILAGRMGGQDQ